MVDRGVGGRGGAGGAARLDDRRAALLHRGDEVVLDPVAVADRLGGVGALDLGVEHVRVLGGRVVAPDRHVGHVTDRGTRLLGDLGDGAVVVQAHHRGEPLLGHVGGVGLRDEAVGVGRVADDQHLEIGGGVIVERLALRLEDPAVGLEQVAALHALGAGPRADEQGDVHPVERLGRVVVDVDPGEQREGAVVELHRRALGGLDRLGDLQQGQVDRGVGPQQVSAGDPEQERVADLAGGARHCNFDWALTHK